MRFTRSWLAAGVSGTAIVVMACQGGTAFAATNTPDPQPKSPSIISGQRGAKAPAPSAATKAKIAAAAKFEAAKKAKAGASPANVALNLVYQIQEGAEWCVPADSRVLLSAFSSSLPSQLVLAGAEHTSNTTGTTYSDAVPILNAYESSNTYVVSNPSGAAQVYNWVDYDTAHVGAATMAAVRGKDLPLWNTYGLDGAHSVAQYGDTGDGSTLRMWDSLDDSRVNGRSYITASTLYYAMNDSGNGIQRYNEFVW
jgi:hypothetical protein